MTESLSICGEKMKMIGYYTIKNGGREAQYDHTRIKSMIRDGLLDRDIADEMGCSKGVVVYVRRKMGIVRGGRYGGEGMSRIDYPKVQELYEQRKSDTQIADELGCSQSAIWLWRHDMGLPNVKDVKRWGPR